MDQVNAFRDPLWETAKAMIADPNGAKGLTDEALLALVDAATEKDGVSPEERALLEIVADPTNVAAIAKSLSDEAAFPGEVLGYLDTAKVMLGLKATFDPTTMQFGGARAKAMDVTIDRAVAGQAISKTYQPEAKIDQKVIARTARDTKIGPGQALTLSTPAGRLAIIDKMSQMAGTPVYGSQACGAASLLAVALNQGPASVAVLASIVAKANPWSADFAALAAELAKPNPSLSMGDLAALQDGLIDVMKSGEIAAQTPGSSGDGLSPDTIVDFQNRYATDLAPMFANGSYVIGVDNSGDGALDHFVARLQLPDGKTAIYEPWERQDGHHLLTDITDVARYDAARTD